ncbi:hypothetical protein GCM10011309_24680 [Litorimonas cladophorae]|uniref:DUF1523 family protein n=1 Tax=Litorimonas cladophorae TaxID=1220491 RepID=A0A918KU98_9PROT|nr:DUF1523 family protein [Litorimonas cladophorae]GGX73659.1 hypothetical protein GCM10011309_24680 [Litorimonas cladophorae]
MKFAKHLPAILLFVFGAVFLNYFLPQNDVVRIVGVDMKRVDIDKDDPFWDRADIGTNEGATRDVRFINTETPKGRTRVYRNEDTGWGFPPYFKFNSSDVTAQAQALAKDDDQWVAVRHYGWRIRMFSIFPNATSMKRVSGPDVFIFPYFNIFFIGLLLVLWFMSWRAIRRWKAKRIDPTLDKVGDTISDAAREVGETVEEGSEKARGFWRKLFGSPK